MLTLSYLTAMKVLEQKKHFWNHFIQPLGSNGKKLPFNPSKLYHPSIFNEQSYWLVNWPRFDIQTFEGNKETKIGS